MSRLALGNFYKFCKLKNNPYELLGLPAQATQQHIKAAYYALAKQYHPDVKPEYSNKFKQINEAYHILKDPAKRAEYDSLVKLSKDKQNIQEVHRSYYHTNFHYGYTKQPKHQQASSYESNPFAYQYDKRFSNQFTRNLFRADNQMQRGKNVKNMSNKVRNITIAFFSLFTILFCAQAMLKIYAFNRIQQKSIVYQYLNPDSESLGLEDD